MLTTLKLVPNAEQQRVLDGIREERMRIESEHAAAHEILRERQARTFKDQRRQKLTHSILDAFIEIGVKSPKLAKMAERQRQAKPRGRNPVHLTSSIGDLITR